MGTLPGAVALLAPGFICSLLALPGAAQTVLTGTVREDSTGRPLQGVEVVLLGYGLKTTTDAAGRFLLGTLPVGHQAVLFRLVGYQPAWLRFRVGKQDTTRAETILVPFNAQQLEPVEVTARSAAPSTMDAFEERRRRGMGHFIDSATMRRSDNVPLFSLLRRHTRVDVKQVYLPDERRYEDWAISRRSRSSDCYMQVILDGISIYQPGQIGRNPPDLGQFHPSSLEALEAYQGPADTPPEFSSGVIDCGTLVLWTRKG